MDAIGKLNLFEVAEFTECLKFKLKIPDMQMGMPSFGGGGGGGAAAAPAEEVCAAQRGRTRVHTPANRAVLFAALDSCLRWRGSRARLCRAPHVVLWPS